MILLQAGLGNATGVLLIIALVATLVLAVVAYFIMKFFFRGSKKEPNNFFIFLGKFMAFVILLGIIGFAVFSVVF
ncbi:MAG: hypothetical protein EAZ08_09735 [Cytophagales bacterium]|nr:MAG: hypothetical protein EAZ08_09735 [Cytophagales bacterium]